ncbi:MAG: pitrilysin family protein, partial [Acidimicrobiales bacterium]
LVTERMPDVRSVTFGVEVGTGSRDEPEAIAGASHFLEHLLFKGTEERSGREISEAVDAAGGDMNACTSRESTTFYIRLLDDDAALGLDLLCDTVLHPTLADADVEVERQVILEEILQHDDDPGDIVHEQWAEAMFAGHPLGRDPLGGHDSVTSTSADEVRRFFAAHYLPGNMVVAAAGHLDHDEVVAAVEARFVDRTGGAAPGRAAPDGSQRRLVVEEDDTEQVHLVVGVRGLACDDDDRHALAVLEHALGGGLSSRLWQQVREERGLAYSVYSFRSQYQGAGTLGVYAGTAPDHLDEVLGLVGAELDALASGGITERERQVAVGHLVGELALSLEDSGSRMARIGRALLVHNEVRTYDEVVARLRAVTLDDVAAVAERVLSLPRTLALVGPVDPAALAGW